jgi:hypothetical protein
MPVFARKDMWLGSTWALKRFRAHQTEINNHYWALAPVAGYADFTARKAPKPTSTAKLFHASGPDVHRLAYSAEEWRSQFKEFQNWVRLAALLSASSYLEVYFRTMISLALQSDPLARFGRSALMDGVTWLKQGLRDEIEPLVRPCLVGDWASRMVAYENVFGKKPALIISNMAELEKIRKLRNSVGHSFGRNKRQLGEDLGAVFVGRSERLAEGRFKKWLGLINQVADAIDGHLGTDHIGEYESLHFYHQWRLQPRVGHEAGFTEARAFSHAIGRLMRRPCGQEFSKGLIAYYDSV